MERADERDALMEWLDEVVAYCVSARGLAVALAYGGSAYRGAGSAPVHDNSCTGVLRKAGTPLLARVTGQPASSAESTMADVITVIVGIVLATEGDRDPLALANRLFRSSVTGIIPHG